MYGEDVTTFFTLSNSVGCLSEKIGKGLMFQWVTYFLGPAQVHNPLSYSQTELSVMIKTLGPSK